MKALLVLTTLVLMTAPAFAAETCKFHLNDISKDELVSVGKTRDEAQGNAATKCFNMYEEASLRKTGHGLYDDDGGVTIVNACANVRCG